MSDQATSQPLFPPKGWRFTSGAERPEAIWLAFEGAWTQGTFGPGAEGIIRLDDSIDPDPNKASPRDPLARPEVPEALEGPYAVGEVRVDLGTFKQDETVFQAKLPIDKRSTIAQRANPSGIERRTVELAMGYREGETPARLLHAHRSLRSMLKEIERGQHVGGAEILQAAFDLAIALNGRSAIEWLYERLRNPDRVQLELEADA